MKKLVIILLSLIIAILLAIFFPWDIFDGLKDKLFDSSGEVASLKVYSLGGDIKVFIDSEEKGIVKTEDAYLEIFPIETGIHEVKLSRVSKDESFYEPLQRSISFVKGFETIISWELGPTEESSSGWILYAQESENKLGYAKLDITCSNDPCDVLIDDERKLLTPIVSEELKLDKQHIFKVSKDGYQDLDFEVLSEESEDRQQLDGYELFLNVNLYEIPL
jgi:hypothetical protein